MLSRDTDNEQLGKISFITVGAFLTWPRLATFSNILAGHWSKTVSSQTFLSDRSPLPAAVVERWGGHCCIIAYQGGGEM